MDCALENQTQQDKSDSQQDKDTTRLQGVRKGVLPTSNSNKRYLQEHLLTYQYANQWPLLLNLCFDEERLMWFVFLGEVRAPKETVEREKPSSLGPLASCQACCLALGGNLASEGYESFSCKFPCARNLLPWGSRLSTSPCLPVACSRGRPATPLKLGARGRQLLGAPWSGRQLAIPVLRVFRDNNIPTVVYVRSRLSHAKYSFAGPACIY